MFQAQKVPERKAPSLVDMCVQLAIDNVSHLGNVGETDFHLLERILSHCNVEQLMHIEDCTEEVDLSPVTDKLWKKFFERQFGADSKESAIRRMKQKNVNFKWRQLYKAKEKSVEDAQQKSFERIRQLYLDEKAKKQGRSIQICKKVPPSTCKRSFYGGPSSAISNTKSNIMKKAKIDFMRSTEVKNLASMRNKVTQRNHSVSATRRPGSSSNMGASSASGIAKPIPR